MPEPVRRELLSFQVGAREFCVDIMAIREIKGWTPATKLPHAPPAICGVVNLRGAVLPVVDLAERIGEGRSVPTPQHVIIVVQVGAQMVGLLVSAVCDILDVTDEMIQGIPDVAAAQTDAFIHGLLTIGDRVLGVLRVDPFLADCRADCRADAA